MNDKTKAPKCCLCHKEVEPWPGNEDGHLKTGYGHNPDPLCTKDTDRCCDHCNATMVIPVRLAGAVFH